MSPESSLLGSLREFFAEFLGRLAAIVPDLLILTAAVLAGAAFGLLVSLLLRLILAATKFDLFSDRVGLTRGFCRAGLGDRPSRYVSRAAGWIVAFVFLLAGAASLKIPGTGNLIEKAFAFLPALLTALVILAVGLLLAGFAARATLVATVNAGYRAAGLISGAVRALVVFLAIAMALEQLGVARGIVVAAFSILLGGVVLAFALAFGFGGREIAKRFLENQLPERFEGGTEDVRQHL
jgi:hypothetical protein